MVYEGQIDGRDWWVATIDNPADDFMMTFTNTNGNWEDSSAYDRHYTGQADDIWVKAYDATIYTSMP